MSFLKDTIFYSSSTLLTQLITFIRGIGVRAILIPEVLGIYNFIQVVLGFITVLDLGSSTAASRELPILRGKKAFEKENLIRSTVFWFTLLQSLVVGFGTIVYAIIYKDNYSNWEFAGFGIAALMLIISGSFSCYKIYFQSAQQYSSLSLIIFIVGVFEAVSFVGGAYFFGINGLLIAYVGISLIKTFIFIGKGYIENIGVGGEFSIKSLKELLVFGFPLKIIDYPKQYMMMIDILWVTALMDIKSLAIYTTSRLFYTQSTQISINMATVFETRIIQRFGREGSLSKIAVHIKNTYIFNC